MRLIGRPRDIAGWVDGRIENAPPRVSEADGIPRGVVDAANNVFFTEAGRVEVRGGSRVKRNFTGQTQTLMVFPFTPIGVVTITYANGLSKYNLQRLTPDFAFFTGVEATSTHDLSTTGSWDNATLTARPVVAELFEKLYVCDANITYADRNNFISVDSAGTLVMPTFDLGGGAEELRPYVLEAYNGVLFAAGYENKTANADSPAILRHSMLGTAPDAAGGWDENAYNFIGSKGQRITALRQGRGLLLIAKANELYRLSGFGRALPGWQYAVEQVTNTLGVGVNNPHALCFAESDGQGYWYGIGEAGPFRTDGFSVESLVGPIRRSWDKITNLSTAVVAHHPDRGCILFAVNQTPIPTGRSATFPNMIMAWDIKRERWAADHQCQADIAYMRAVPTATAQGPTAAPTGLTITHASATTSSIAVSWTNADAAAYTEVWARTPTGGSMLLHTANPAATSATISSLLNGTNYKVKVRHIKNGIASDYTAEADAYTVPSAPELSNPYSGASYVQLRATVTVDHGAVLFERAMVQIASVDITAVGNVEYQDTGRTCGTSYDYRARVYMSTWPVGIEYSAYDSDTFESGDCPPGHLPGL